MKKMFILGLILVMPLAVKAEVSSSTQAIGASADAKTQVEESLKLNGSLKNATNGFYIEGLEISCVNGTRSYTILNDAIASSLTCSNGNTKPYYDIKADGTSGKGIANGSSCTVNENEGKLYATRIYKYDCDYVAGSTDDNKIQFTTTTTSTTTTNSGSNKDGDTTKDTGTTDNKDTGVEDYFIALGTIGVVVTALLYVIDKKNVFKKI